MHTLFALPQRASKDLEESWEWEKKPSQAPSIEETCPNCFNTDCLYTTDLTTCCECGHVLARPFDTGAEYRFFSHEDRGGDPTRVGAPMDPRLPEASLGTVILGGRGCAKAMWRVRKYHSWNTVPYKERVYLQTCERLSLISLNAGINQATVDDTKHLYVTLHDIGGRQGLSRDALLSACLYTSLKQSGSPRKPKDVADLFGISSTGFTKAIKQMQEIMALARQKGLLQTRPSDASTQAVEYIQLPLSRLPISRAQIEPLLQECRRVAVRAEEIGLSQENMPPSLAAACIAFVVKRAEVDLSFAKIAAACEISVATLQKCLRRLEAFQAQLTDA